jgi:hypothetical protein
VEVACVIALVLVAVCALAVIPPMQARGLGNAAERFKIEDEARKTLTQIVLGAFGLVVLYFAWRRVRVAEQGHITDRYTKAVEQLGKLDGDKPNIEIRLGGIYALEGAEFEGAQMEEAILTLARMEWARLKGAHLERALLFKARLEAAQFNEAHLEGAALREAHMERVTLDGAHLEGAILVGAHLEDAAGITVQQIKSAYGWEKAHYSPEFRQQLGLADPAPDGDRSADTGQVPPGR